MSSPFEEIGGADAVRQLAERFYDWMRDNEPELTAVHELDSSGDSSRRSRDRFALFLVGWLGGPQDYVAENGHPRLRMRHAQVPVTIALRDAWLRCMFAAMDDCAIPSATQEFLRPRFSELADFMRNVDEP